MAAQQKFFEIVKPGVDIDFIGKRRYWIGFSILLVLFTGFMLVANAYLIPGRGRMLNWGVDFRGGTEIVVSFSKPVEVNQIREALSSAGYHGAEVVRFVLPGEDHTFMLRFGAVSVLSEEQAQKTEASLAKVGEASLRRFEWSEGGDKIYLRFDRQLETSDLEKALAGAGVPTTVVKTFGRADDNTYEVTLIGLDREVRTALDAKLGEGTVKSIPSVASVGAKAGKQLRDDGIRALLGAMVLIVIYIAFRFDFRYGPGTIIALLHDAVITIGAFAVTYREFSLVTLAALLTIIGYSVNDTVVIFDRIRENAARYRDRKFDRVVNQSVNETLSRTILTSATVFFVTLAMNIFGTGVVRDFAFAMNIGIIVGAYSSVFIASPTVIWLNEKYLQAQKKAPRPGRRPARQEPRPGEEEPVETT